MGPAEQRLRLALVPGTRGKSLVSNRSAVSPSYCRGMAGGGESCRTGASAGLRAFAKSQTSADVQNSRFKIQDSRLPGRRANPKCKIQNRKQRIQNRKSKPKSKVENLKSKIENPRIVDPLIAGPSCGTLSRDVLSAPAEARSRHLS